MIYYQRTSASSFRSNAFYFALIWGPVRGFQTNKLLLKGTRLRPFLGSCSLLLLYSTQWAGNKVTFLIEFGAWEDVDLSLDFGKVVQLLASSTILAKFPHSDPRLPMLQIAKERYRRVQLTELYKMRPEPNKGRTLETCGVCWRVCHRTFSNTSKLIQQQLSSDWFSGPPPQKCRRTVVF